MAALSAVNVSVDSAQRPIAIRDSRSELTAMFGDDKSTGDNFGSRAAD